MQNGHFVTRAPLTEVSSGVADGPRKASDVATVGPSASERVAYVALCRVRPADQRAAEKGGAVVMPMSALTERPADVTGPTLRDVRRPERSGQPEE
jgi:hypothetical protein